MTGHAHIAAIFSQYMYIASRDRSRKLRKSLCAKDPSDKSPHVAGVFYYVGDNSPCAPHLTTFAAAAVFTRSLTHSLR